ncbi:PA0069 family radical SAM protein [Sphingosinicella sp. BN140058]|uniref:PA0069 family radical SAM protein n=1 Tax=Sphingosinicella sp. BN140058 TaxID=1892855 RepID=UPI001010CEDD|nr:PA0069 family radical SAM protein [Sphingosinicella sp. BN140058]QAY78601.1 PA0069 family radical SAM protein [Sphingosinicella sp. BN140058]
MSRPDVQHGRGAPENRTPTRFNLPVREADGDWLDAREDLDGGPPPLRTTVTVEKPKTIIARNTSPDIGFDRSINPYRGCEHGCIYCFARPTHAFHDLSPGLDFESKLFAKPDAAALLRAELSKRGYVPRPMALGTNTDPYQPIEARWKITRSVLQVLAETRHPLTITTKSDRVTRDIDILAPMAADGLASVAISVTSLTPAISRTLEPRAPAARKRLAAVRMLTEAGIPAHVAIAPVIPGITDHEVEQIVEAAAEAGAVGVFYLPVRLPHEVAPLFRAWLDEHFGDRAGKVMNIIRELRGGRDNDPDFFTRMRGSGPWADLIATRFKIAMTKHGLTREKASLRTDLFVPPQGAQLRLL